MSALSPPTDAPAKGRRGRAHSGRLGVAGWISVGVLAFWLAVALLAPLLAPHTESTIVIRRAFAVIGTDSVLLGSDYLGRDVLSRIMFGARMTLGIALAACLVAFAIGATLGFAAALSRGRIDEILSRTNDAFLAFPSIMLALIVISTLGSSLAVLVLTIGFIEATRTFRVARAIGMDVSVMDFVDVSRTRGESTWWILCHDILPNGFGPLSTEFGLRLIYSILLISTLSFVGLGVQPPYSDWGGMVRENMAGVHFFASAVLLPAICIFSVTLAVNLLVDWNLGRTNRDISREMLT